MGQDSSGKVVSADQALPALRPRSTNRPPHPRSAVEMRPAEALRIQIGFKSAEPLAVLAVRNPDILTLYRRCSASMSAFRTVATANEVRRHRTARTSSLCPTTVRQAMARAFGTRMPAG